MVFFIKYDLFFKSPNLQKNIPKNYPELEIQISAHNIIQWNLDLRKILGVTKIFLKSRFFLISNTRKPLKKHNSAKWTSETIQISYCFNMVKCFWLYFWIFSYLLIKEIRKIWKKYFENLIFFLELL